MEKAYKFAPGECIGPFLEAECTSLQGLNPGSRSHRLGFKQRGADLYPVTGRPDWEAIAKGSYRVHRGKSWRPSGSCWLVPYPGVIASDGVWKRTGVPTSNSNSAPVEATLACTTTLRWLG